MYKCSRLGFCLVDTGFCSVQKIYYFLFLKTSLLVFIFLDWFSFGLGWFTLVYIFMKNDWLFVYAGWRLVYAGERWLKIGWHWLKIGCYWLTLVEDWSMLVDVGFCQPIGNLLIHINKISRFSRELLEIQACSKLSWLVQVWFQIG